MIKILLKVIFTLNISTKLIDIWFILGLFSQAIIQSGSALNPWAFVDKPRERALRFAKVLGCDLTDSDQLKEFFLNVPASDLIRAQEVFLTDMVFK